MANEIPLLSAQDVELRVNQIQQSQYGTYVTLLCYKDARCDMKMLDLVFGPMNWKREHQLIGDNLYCTVSVFDEYKGEWISKQDVGVESNTEATKGQASDAFKRACFNIGIGRELYNAPDIRFKLNDNEVFSGSNGKPKTYAKFHVGNMFYDKERGIFTEFTVLDEAGNVRYNINSGRKSPTTTTTHAANTEQKFSNSPVTPATTSQAKPSPTPSANDETVRCCECNSIIKSQKVLSFALKRFGRKLCYNCQMKNAA